MFLHIIRKYNLILLFFVFPSLANAQTTTIEGRVTDFENRRPLEAVAVITTAGKGTITDSLGRFSMQVNKKDSVYFSYLGKNTRPMPADTIANSPAFELGLHIDSRWLPSVTVKNRSYTMDSIQNRRDYEKYFNFKKPGIALSSNPPSTYTNGSLTVGLDLDEFINMFRFKRNRSLALLQQRLLQDEQDKYINHRFTKLFVRKLTGLEGEQQETFMKIYRPQYDVLLQMNDLELGYYIEICYKKFKQTSEKFYSPLKLN
ncbi:MAG: hypothetical protein J0I41_05695 [Filimonas sp.]|nr:hypothetical protein [Filimonas sp.]